MAKFDYQKYFGEIAPLADALRESEQRPWQAAVPRDPEQRDYVLYLGCNVLRTVNLAESVVEILRYLEVDFAAVGGPANCCGVIHEQNGESDTGDKLRHKSLGNFGAFKPKEVLTFCPTCHMRMDEVAPDKEGFHTPYRHLSEFLVEQLPRMRFVNRVERRIALHGHAAAPQQEKDCAMIRTLLEAIPGLEVVVLPGLPELGHTCSPHRSKALGEGRFKEIVDGFFKEAAAAELDAVVTAYHGCYRMYCDWEVEYRLEVLHYATLLCQGLGLHRYRETYKQHRLAGDPEAAFRALKPAAEERGVNLAKLEQATRSHFPAPVPKAEK